MLDTFNDLLFITFDGPTTVTKVDQTGIQFQFGSTRIKLYLTTAFSWINTTTIQFSIGKDIMVQLLSLNSLLSTGNLNILISAFTFTTSTVQSFGNFPLNLYCKEKVERLEDWIIYNFLDPALGICPCLPQPAIADLNATIQWSACRRHCNFQGSAL